MQPIFTRVFPLLIALFCYSKSTFSQCGAALAATGNNLTVSANSTPNTFYPGTGSPAAGSATLTLGVPDVRGNATNLAAGDMVLIIQMQGADISSANNDSYGDGVAGGNASGYLSTNLQAGKFEYNIVSSYNTTSRLLTLSYNLANSYATRASTTSLGSQAYQVIRVRRNYNITINSGVTITAPAWNGQTGGVVVMEATNTFAFTDNTSIINVNGLGFRGGGGKSRSGAIANNTNGSGPIANTDYRWPSYFTNAENMTGGSKGEGIAGSPFYTFKVGQGDSAKRGTVEGYIAGSFGRGAPGNAGGGGTDGDVATNQYNTGGGGGGNGGAGGRGGSGWDSGPGNADTYNTGGFGGAAYAQATTTRAVMGGGGGAGTSNNATFRANDSLSSGASGGGIVLLRARSFTGSGRILANGDASYDVSTTDAAGGGGAGGTIIVLVNQAAASAANTISASANGGKGGNSTIHWAHGPGGGGGGGVIISNAIGGTKSVAGGANGLTRHCCSTGGAIDEPYHSEPGSGGVAPALTTYPLLLSPGNATSPCGILPITIESWSGVYRNEQTYLNWQTDKGVDFSHFVVERSTNGIHYMSLGKVAPSTSTALTLQYSFVDIAPASGINYYRLKMVDNNGTYQYSGIITIRTNVEGFNVTASPNPFTDNVVITIESKTDETVHLRVFNNDGKQVWRKSIAVSTGTNVQYFNDLQSLPKGIYILKVNKQNTETSLKLVKQ